MYPSDDGSSRQEAKPLGPIAAKTKLCLKSFDNIISAWTQDGIKVSRDVVEDNATRLRLWAGNIGAHHIDSRSADHRVRDAPEVALRILELLDEVLQANDDLYQIVSGARVDASDEISDDELLPDDEGGSEAEEICLMVADAITSLLKVSSLLRKATGRDRYAKAAAAADQPFLPDFDIRHVSDKFPKTARMPWLRDRLGKANVQRRQYLRYARKHHDRLAHEPVDAIMPANLTGFQLDVPYLRPKTVMSSRPTLAPTDASTLLVDYIKPTDLQGLEVNDLDDTMSQATSMVASAVDGDKDRDLNVIRLSEVSKDGDPFECPYCYTIVQTRRQSSWRKHVLRDVRAWACTFPDCSSGLFEDRESWFRHELDQHRRNWTCQSCPDKVCSSAIDMELHLEVVHRIPASEARKAVVDSSSRPVTEIEASACPLCDDWETQLRSSAAQKNIPIDNVLVVSLADFRRHLGYHQEQLALFAIPPNLERSVDSETSTESQEAAPPLERGEAMDKWQQTLNSASEASDTPNEHNNDDSPPQSVPYSELQPPGSPMKEAVSKATESSTRSPRAVIDLVNHSRDGPEDVIRAIMKRLLHTSLEVQLNTLKLTDDLVQNCGLSFHAIVASVTFTDELVQLASNPDSHATLREKIFVYMNAWSRMFQHKPELAVMARAVENLQHRTLRDQSGGSGGDSESNKIINPEGTTDARAAADKSIAVVDTDLDNESPAPQGALSEKDAIFGLYEHEVESFFASFDSTGSGFLSESQTVQLFSQAQNSFNVDPQTSAKLFHMFAREDRGLDLEEFRGLLEFLGAWKKLFDRFEYQDLGYLGESQFSDALAAFGYRLSERCTTILFEEFATNEPYGHHLLALPFMSFVQACIFLKRLTDAFKGYDQDRDGYISPNAVGSIVADALEADRHPDFYTQLHAEINKAGSERGRRGYVGFQEFVTVAAGLAEHMQFSPVAKNDRATTGLETRREASTSVPAPEREEDSGVYSDPLAADTRVKIVQPPEPEHGLPARQDMQFSPASKNDRAHSELDAEQEGATDADNRAGDKGIDDEDAYSYTDAAGMYRDTEPRWREVPPRRSNADRDELRRERPVAMYGAISGPRQAAEEFGPPPSTRGWDKINDNLSAPGATKGILKQSTAKFPEQVEFIREGVVPLAMKKNIPPAARWTKIDRRLVSPEALERAHERFEERLDCVIVLRVLTKEEIQKLADDTRDEELPVEEPAAAEEDLLDTPTGDEDYELLGLVSFGF